MPTYLYECPECGEFELYQPVSDPPLQRCECGEPVRKLIAPLAGTRVEAETSSPEYLAWFHSDSVQSKLKSGEFQVVPKSHDINHR